LFVLPQNSDFEIEAFTELSEARVRWEHTYPINYGAIESYVSAHQEMAMTQTRPDDLWREFPKTATEFEARFATEEDCRAYWIKARWE
jgi:hypothetical protein